MTQLAQASGTQSSFNEFLATPINFSAFIMNRPKLNNLTQDVLTGLTYDLIKGTCKSVVELEYHLEEVFKATNDQLDWHNPEGRPYPHDLSTPLPLIQNTRGRQVIPFDHFINNDLEYLKGGSLSKLTNLNLDERFALNVALRMYTRRIIIQERIIYQDDMDRNRLMRTDELHKFSDGTLNHVRTTLNDIATGIQMEYLPKRKWSKQDKQRAQVMINAIDKKLRDRRLMRSLEKFVEHPSDIIHSEDGNLARTNIKQAHGSTYLYDINYPHLDNGIYDVFDRVMRPLALRQTRRPRSDRGKSYQSVSSTSAHHNRGSSSHQGDDDEDDGASRASTPSPTTYLNSLGPLDYQQYDVPTSSEQNDDLLFEHQTDLLNQT
ncbi:hypothetical protein Tco_0857423 [Tanacetum coccineum]|uniref:Uncharacterized protein n=1 Tax=Tanacetum coccineum TaxID=301880 RepID=A0ABQ5BA71_9ASTR